MIRKINESGVQLLNIFNEKGNNNLDFSNLTKKQIYLILSLQNEVKMQENEIFIFGKKKRGGKFNTNKFLEKNFKEL